MTRAQLIVYSEAVASRNGICYTLDGSQACFYDCANGVYVLRFRTSGMSKRKFESLSSDNWESVIGNVYD